MRGNTLTEFMDDLLTMGGPEKEFLFRGKRYFMEAQPYEEDPEQTEFVIFACFGDEENLFRCHGKNNEECVRQFEKARIFDGFTIYEAESEIEVLFG